MEYFTWLVHIPLAPQSININKVKKFFLPLEIIKAQYATIFLCSQVSRYVISAFQSSIHVCHPMALLLRGHYLTHCSFLEVSQQWTSCLWKPVKSRLYNYPSFLSKMSLNWAFKLFFLIAHRDANLFSETFLADGFTSQIRSYLHAKHSPLNHHNKALLVHICLIQSDCMLHSTSNAGVWLLHGSWALKHLSLNNLHYCPPYW